MDYLSYIFPKDLVEYFKVTDFKELSDVDCGKTYYEIYLAKNNFVIGVGDQHLYESKGFSSVQIQDFPLRGNGV